MRQLTGKPHDRDKSNDYNDLPINSISNRSVGFGSESIYGSTRVMKHEGLGPGPSDKRRLSEHKRNATPPRGLVKVEADLCGNSTRNHPLQGFSHKSESSGERQTKLVM